MTVTGVELARILGLSKARISQLKSEGVLTVTSGGKFDLPKSVQAYIAHLETGALSPELAEHRAKLIQQQTRRLRIANDKEEKKLVNVEDVEHVWAQSTMVLVQMLDAIPGRLAAPLAAESDVAICHAKLKAEIRAARQMMADKYEELANEMEIRSLTQTPTPEEESQS